MQVLNSIANEILENLAFSAGAHLKYDKDLALTAREVQTAARLLLPPEMAADAEKFAHIALEKYKLN